MMTEGEAAVRLHRQYNDIVREVSRSEGVDLLDLEGEMDAAYVEDLRSLFMRDGIHLTASGLASFSAAVAVRICLLAIRPSGNA